MFLKKYEILFKDDLTLGELLERNLSHGNFIEANGKPTHRTLFHLYSEERKAVKNYVHFSLNTEWKTFDVALKLILTSTKTDVTVYIIVINDYLISNCSK